MDDVLFERRRALGLITLNRPKALNAVTHAMVRAIAGQLDVWERDTEITRVAIAAVPGRAFSAGGDLRALYDLRKAGDPALMEFYRDEYRLNRRIRTFPKPFVALVDGIVMGGGVGVSFHGSHRVATENTVFAMPEVAVGFYPDVGGTWFLGRTPGRIGEYLGLTGARIGAADLVFTGLATHACEAARLEELTGTLAAGDDVDAAVGEVAREPEPALLAGRQPAIDRTFMDVGVEQILARLDGWPNDGDKAWAGDTARLMRANAPLSLKVALRQIRLGRDLDFDACMKLEFQLTRRFMNGHDFFEGVRAIVVDKDKSPHWQPATLGDVSDARVAACFVPEPDALTFIA